MQVWVVSFGALAGIQCTTHDTLPPSWRMLQILWCWCSSRSWRLQMLQQGLRLTTQVFTQVFLSWTDSSVVLSASPRATRCLGPTMRQPKPPGACCQGGCGAGKCHQVHAADRGEAGGP